MVSPSWWTGFARGLSFMGHITAWVRNVIVNGWQELTLTPTAMCANHRFGGPATALASSKKGFQCQVAHGSFSITNSAWSSRRWWGIAKACWTPSILKYGASDRGTLTKPAAPVRRSPLRDENAKLAQEGRTDHMVGHCVCQPTAKAVSSRCLMTAPRCGPISPLHIAFAKG